MEKKKNWEIENERKTITSAPVYDALTPDKPPHNLPNHDG